MRTFQSFAALSAAADLAAHMYEVCRHFPAESDRLDTAEELIDRAERRGAITVEDAANLWRLAQETLRSFTPDIG